MRLFLLLCLFELLTFQMYAQPLAKDGGALAFKENKSQWDSRILYETEYHNGSLFLCKTNLTFVLEDSADMTVFRQSHHPHLYNPNLSMIIHGYVFRENFVNTNPGCKIGGSEKLKEYFNYYIGKDPSHWAAGVGGFYHVVYQDIYKGVNLDVSSVGTRVKYDFIVKPGAKTSDILINYQGLDGVSINGEDLVLKTSVGDVVDAHPYAYQVINGQTREVKCNFQLEGNNVSFIFPDGYDYQAELVIDPVLIFSTYSGSTTDNFGYSATYDSKGNVYAAGTAFYLAGESYPVTPGAFQVSWAGGVGFGQSGLDGTGTDVAITKYDSAGTTRIYSTYLGGDHDELPHSLTVNSNDELFVLGTTASDNFPVTPNAFDTTFKGGPDPGVFAGIGVHYSTGCDMFITHFNAGGTALIGSTYLGGTQNDGITYPEYTDLNYNYADEVRGEIAIDNNNNVYIASCTRSADFPVTAGAYQTTLAGGSDGVVVKMNNALTSVIWATFLGGADEDAIYSIDFDPNNDLYVAGGTISPDFPHTAGVMQPVDSGGRAEGFIAHLSQNGNALLQSTFYGTPEYDQVYFVRTDKAGYPYVFGQTKDVTGRFIHNATYSVPQSGQFISKLSPHLDSVVWSTVFGNGNGQPNISPTAFSVDVCNKTYISGWGSNFYLDYNIAGAPALSTQGMYITPNAIQTANNNQQFYVMVMDDNASGISFATIFGSTSDEQHVDGGTSRFDRKGIIYQSVCAGCDGQSTFPTTTNAVSRTNNSPNCNNAVFKMDLQIPIVVADFSGPGTICIPDTVRFTNSSKTVAFVKTGAASYLWSFGDGTFSNQQNPAHVYTQAGLYTVQLIVNDPGSCNFVDTFSEQILVLSPTAVDTIPAVNVCSGQSVQIGINSGIDSAVTYLWTPSNNLTQNNVSNPFASPKQTTTYQLLVSNGLCLDTFFQTVNVFGSKLALAGGSVLCANDTLQLSVVDSIPNQQLTYIWQPVNQIISGDSTANPLVSPAANTIYSVKVVNQMGCVFYDSVQVSISSSIPAIGITAVPDTITVGDSSQLTLSLSANVVSYQWAPDTTLSAANILNPYADPVQTHKYMVVVRDSVGCLRSDTITIYVLPAPCKSSNIYVPDAFTPNGDGKNDVLYVRGVNLISIDFAVYDRWGQKMFETTDITRGWDGTFNGKKMDPAVFGYYLKAQCAGGEYYEKKGNVTLLR